MLVLYIWGSITDLSSREPPDLQPLHCFHLLKEKGPELFFEAPEEKNIKKEV